MRRCSTCGVEKPEAEFYRRSAPRRGLRSSCKECEKRTSQKWLKANPERYRAAVKRRYDADPKRWRAKATTWRDGHLDLARERQRRSALKSMYDATEDELRYRLEVIQGGSCGLCRVPLEWDSRKRHVDHVVVEGRPLVRSILCANCNTGLGKLQEDPELLRRAAEYVETCGAFAYHFGPISGVR